MSELTQIGKEEFTEKVSHGFLDIYEDIWWSKFDRLDPITLLEIGVYNGNSLKVWDRWFLRAETKIVGIDKYDNPIRPKLSYRVQIEKGDQADTDFLKTIVEKYKSFDIIIDDGGHHWHEQQISFDTLWPFVKEGGMYIIEDLHAVDDPQYESPTAEYDNTAEFLMSMARDFLVYDQSDMYAMKFYHKLAVLYKK